MIDAAKERLLKMREEALDRAIRRGQVSQIAAIDAALAALDEAPTKYQPASRAVVGDDGKTIRLTLYAETGAVALVELDPTHAIALAGKLIDAALPKLG